MESRNFNGRLSCLFFSFHQEFANVLGGSKQVTPSPRTHFLGFRKMGKNLDGAAAILRLKNWNLETKKQRCTLTLESAYHNLRNLLCNPDTLHKSSQPFCLYTKEPPIKPYTLPSALAGYFFTQTLDTIRSRISPGSGEADYFSGTSF